jgi:hypothetical protein
VALVLLDKVMRVAVEHLLGIEVPAAVVLGRLELIQPVEGMAEVVLPLQ